MASFIPRDTTQPSFEVRRETFSGDLVRGPEGYRSAIRFGDPILESVVGDSLLLSRPEGYDGIKVWWGVPPEGLGTWVYMAVVRSGFGHPLTPSDGMILNWTGAGTPVDDLPGAFVDTPLMPGRWYYYSLMFMTANNRWVVVGKTQNLVPIDYGHGADMYRFIPPFYIEMDEEHTVGDQRGRSHLRKFLDVVGYDLDLTRTLVEGLEYLYDPDLAPLALYKQLGVQNFGFEDNDALGGGRIRSVIAASREILDRRGTLLGLSRYLEAATKFECHATNGANLMMVGDDSHFNSGTGNWAPTPFGMNDTLRGISDGVLNGGVEPEALDTRHLTMETLDVSDPNTYPNIPTLPLELTDYLSPVNHVVKVDPNGGDLLICCGAGQKDRPIGINDETGLIVHRYSHLTPTFRGIPVEEDSIYHFSFYMARDAGNTENDRVEIGAALFGRDLDLPPFSDAFSGSGINSYTQVVPNTIDLVWSSVLLDDFNWSKYVVTLKTNPGDRFLVPFIWVNTGLWNDPSGGSHQTATPRYITAVMVTKGQGVSIETAYSPGIHLLITANDMDTDNVVGSTTRVIGEPRQ